MAKTKANVAACGVETNNVIGTIFIANSYSFLLVKGNKFLSLLIKKLLTQTSINVCVALRWKQAQSVKKIFVAIVLLIKYMCAHYPCCHDLSSFQTPSLKKLNFLRMTHQCYLDLTLSLLTQLDYQLNVSFFFNQPPLSNYYHPVSKQYFAYYHQLVKCRTCKIIQSTSKHQVIHSGANVF